MDKRNTFLIFAIVMLVVVLGLFLYQVNHSSVQKRSRVLVASTDLSRGSRIVANQIHWKQYPSDKINAMLFRQSNTPIAKIVNGVVLRDVKAGQAITRADVIPAGVAVNYDDLLAKNMRAITLSISRSGAGMIQPGDVADVILTYSLGVPNQANASATTTADVVSKTLLHNILVIGVQGGAAQAGGKKTQRGLAETLSIGRSQAGNFVFVTLELTPKQVEILSVGQRVGRLSLSLNGRYVATITGEQSYTTSQAVSDLGLAPMPEQVRQRDNIVTIIRGADKEVVNLQQLPTVKTPLMMRNNAQPLPNLKLQKPKVDSTPSTTTSSQQASPQAQAPKAMGPAPSTNQAPKVSPAPGSQPRLLKRSSLPPTESECATCEKGENP